jgi:uncharacterized protein YceK
MKKLFFCFAAFIFLSGCASNWNCRACKANSDKDKANAGTEKVMNEIGSQKAK